MRAALNTDSTLHGSTLMHSVGRPEQMTQGGEKTLVVEVGLFGSCLLDTRLQDVSEQPTQLHQSIIVFDW